MDITEFMTWWLSQVLQLFTKIFNLLDSIQFMGTSLLKVILTILILSVLIPVILTISRSTNFVGSKADKIKSRRSSDE